MNLISVEKLKSKYVDDPHLTILIDRIPLDRIIDEAVPDMELLGLIPTLLNWMDSKSEIDLTWQRIFPQPGEKSISPVLICPDDLDFHCTTIVAEISRNEDHVKWLRLGIDKSSSCGLTVNIGEEVEWFNNIQSYEFEIGNYKQFIQSFK